MMRNLSAILMIIVVPLLFSCSSSDDWYTVNNGDLIREWHLIKVDRIPMFPDEGNRFSSVDYSDKTIVYNFQKGAIVKISGVDEGDLFSIPNGIYSYKMKDDQDDDSADMKYIEINHIKWGLSVSEDQLVLSQISADGPNLIFEPWEG